MYQLYEIEYAIKEKSSFKKHTHDAPTDINNPVSGGCNESILEHNPKKSKSTLSAVINDKQNQQIKELQSKNKQLLAANEKLNDVVNECKKFPTVKRNQ
jgi:hypothetical protein